MQTPRKLFLIGILIGAAFGCARRDPIIGVWDVRTLHGHGGGTKATFQENGYLMLEHVVAAKLDSSLSSTPSMVERQQGTFALQGDHLTMRLYTMEIDNLNREYDEHVPYLPGAKKLSKERDGFIDWKSTNEFDLVEMGARTTFRRSGAAF